MLAEKLYLDGISIEFAAPPCHSMSGLLIVRNWMALLLEIMPWGRFNGNSICILNASFAFKFLNSSTTLALVCRQTSAESEIRDEIPVGGDFSLSPSRHILRSWETQIEFYCNNGIRIWSSEWCELNFKIVNMGWNEQIRIDRKHICLMFIWPEFMPNALFRLD